MIAHRKFQFEKMYTHRDIHFKKIKVKKSLFNSYFLKFLTDFNKIHIIKYRIFFFFFFFFFSNTEKYEHSEYVHYVMIIPRVLVSFV